MDKYIQIVAQTYIQKCVILSLRRTINEKTCKQYRVKITDGKNVQFIESTLYIKENPSLVIETVPVVIEMK